MDVDRIRKDFPIFERRINGKPIVYMDSACVTLRPVQVIEAISRYYREFPACAGRSMHRLGQITDEEVRKSRETIQRFLGARRAEEIIFTKNTTEGINLVANSLPLEAGDIVLTSDKEHNSVLLPFQLLGRKGVQHRRFRFGDLADFQSKLDRKVKLVSMVYTSNMDGTSNPVEEMVRLAHQNGSLALIDAAQAIPHKEINVRRLDVDFLAFSGHKMLGPSGTGVLYGKLERLEELDPFIVGGDTVTNSTYDSYEPEEVPARFEAGLQDYAGIIGLAEAVRYLTRVGQRNIEAYLHRLNELISSEFKKLGVDILGDPDPGKRSGIVSFNIKGLDPHEIAGILDEGANIMIRSGMHCVHSWFNAHNLKGSARVSLFLYNTPEECQVLVEEVGKLCQLAR